ncbi:MAG: PASTA domain-containing protein, partial [Oscillospiraceae bacterium]
MPLDQAAALLNSLNIQYEISEISDIEYRDGTVIKSSIPFGETIYKTRVIVLLTVARNTPEAPSSSSSSVPKYALDTPKSTEPKYGFVDNPELNPPNN